MKYHSDYYIYNKKEELLHKLIDVCLVHDMNYVVQHSTALHACHISSTDQEIQIAQDATSAGVRYSRL